MTGGLVAGGGGAALDRIVLTGVVATGHHGVLPEERRDGQLFSVDVTLHLDTRPAAAADELGLTVDYAALAVEIRAAVAGEPVDLVETLAQRVATIALARPQVEVVDVVVHKPHAPVGVALEDVQVRIRRHRADVVSAAEPATTEPGTTAEPVVPESGAAEADAIDSGATESRAAESRAAEPGAAPGHVTGAAPDGLAARRASGAPGAVTGPLVAAASGAPVSTAARSVGTGAPPVGSDAPPVPGPAATAVLPAATPAETAVLPAVSDGDATAVGAAPTLAAPLAASSGQVSSGQVAPTTDRAADVLDRRPDAEVGVVLALGGNVGDVRGTLRQAIAELDATDGLRITGISPLARTAAVGPAQDDYLNVVLTARTRLSPRELLAVTSAIEDAHGRVREERWGPRTLDIDIVVVDGVTSVEPELELPHPRAHERAFVLVPWAELDREAVLPGLGGGSVSALAATAPDRDGVRWLALDWFAARAGGPAAATSGSGGRAGADVGADPPP